MKKLLTLTACCVFSASAFAADIPAHAELTKSVISSAPWTGVHIGLNAGGLWSSNSSTASSTLTDYKNIIFNATSLSTAATSANTYSSGGLSGFVGGGQIGYDHYFDTNQIGVIAGFETDIQGVAASGFNLDKSNIAPVPGSNVSWLSTINTSTTLDFLGTARGRVGVLITPDLLIYGTGGFAYGGISGQTGITWLGTPQSSFISGGASFYGQGSGSTIATGWTAGGGFEWMFAPNWSAKTEYLYYDLGKLTYNFTSARSTDMGLAALYSTETSTRLNGNLVRVGVNYHFGVPFNAVIAKY